MKILVWNARGMGSSRAFRVLRSFKQAHSPDIIFLMETKADYNSMEVIRVKLGFSSKLVVNCSGRKGGLCLFWSDHIDVSLLSYSNFHIEVRVISHSDISWRFTGFYGHLEAS